jgi:hypothetical protein
MSTSYYADMVAGFAVPKARLRFPTRKRGCAHEVPKDANFCPTCGKEAWKEGQGRIIFTSNRFKQFEPNTRNLETEDDTLPYIFGRKVTTPWAIDSEQCAALEAELRQELTEQRIPVDTPFALHLVLSLG